MARGGVLFLSAALVLWLFLQLSGARNEAPSALNASAERSTDSSASRELVSRASSYPARTSNAASPASAPTDPATVPSCTLDGLLVFAAGAPTPPPRVELIREEPSFLGNHLSVWAARAFEERSPAAVAAPSAGGLFEFRNLAPGSYSVRVFGESLMPAFSDIVTLDEANPKHSLTLRLEAGMTVHGVILNESGEGVADAAVNLRPAKGEPGTKAVSVRVVSGADGSFTVSAPDLRSVTLQVAATGYAAATKTFTPSELAVEVVLRRGTAVTGRMRRKDGGFVEGASVVLLGRSSGSHVVLFAKTGADGRYRIDGAPLMKRLPDDDLPMLLKVRAPGLWILDPEESYGGDTLEVPLLDAFVEAIQLDLVMRDARRVTGRVLDFESKKPLAGVAILGNPESVLDGSVTTDFEGRFMVGVLAEWAHLTPRRPHFEPCDESGGPPRATLPAASVELWMRPTREARGLVVSESGLPICGAVVTRRDLEVSGVSPLAQSRAVSESATTDGNGRFTMTDVPRLFGSRYTAVHPDFPAGGNALFDPHDVAAEDLRIEMRVGAVVRGQVQFPNAAGAPGVRVTAYASISGNGFRKTPTNPLREAMTDADGSFVLRGLLADVVHLSVMSKRDDFGFFGTTAVDLASAPPSDLVVLQLVKLETISGEVVDELGRPVAGAAVLVYPAQSLTADVCDPELDEERVRTRTNDAGRFELRGLDPEAPVDLRVGHWSSKDRSIRVLRGGAANEVRPGTSVLTITIL